jgi:hypothetical protein
LYIVSCLMLFKVKNKHFNSIFSGRLCTHPFFFVIIIIKLVFIFGNDLANLEWSCRTFLKEVAIVWFVSIVELLFSVLIATSATCILADYFKSHLFMVKVLVCNVCVHQKMALSCTALELLLWRKAKRPRMNVNCCT